ncbi:SgcJ/EcaC family oxidoreductase [Actinoallomurus sp. NPDC050550]|uniref:SgcJ/EcaC family oxidoreductase n=1 Tax=Actinoallomurus sp. NPDC050550 TaxID=3154937 RepID=UPI0033D2A1CB
MTESPSISTHPSPADHEAVAALPRKLVEVWAAHDADGFGDLFVKDGTMVLPGVYVAGNNAIAAFMRDAFAGVFKGTRVTGKPVNVRFFGPKVGLVITEGGVIAADRTELADEDAIRASWLVVKRDGEWRLASYQNSPRDAR